MQTDPMVPNWLSDIDLRKKVFWNASLPLCLLILPLVLVVTPKAASWLPIVILLLCLTAMRVEDLMGWVSRIGAFQILALWLVYAGIMTLAVGNPKLTLYAALPTIATAFYGICNWHIIRELPAEHVERNSNAVLVGVFAGSLFLALLLTAIVKLTWLYPYAHGNSVYYNRGAVFVATMTPLVVWLTYTNYGRWPAVFAAVITLLPCWLSQSETAKLCSVFGLLMLAAWRWKRQRALAVSLVGISAAFILWLPTAALMSAALDQFAPTLDHGKFGSMRYRIDFYAHAASLVKTSPLWGKGVHALQLLQLTPDGRPLPPGLKSHPHSAIAQIWLDGGLIAILAALSTILYALVRLARAATPRADVMAATLISALAGSAVSHGLWQSWFHGILALALACAALVPAADAHHDASKRPDL